jgi:hypothetical protein
MSMFHDVAFGIIQDVVSYHLGLIFLRVVTKGRFPPEPISDGNRRKVEIVGLVILVCLIVGTVYTVSELL